MKRKLRILQYILKNKSFPSTEQDFIQFDFLLSKVSKTILLLEEFGLFSYDLKSGGCADIARENKVITASTLALDYPYYIYQDILNILERNKDSFLIDFRNWKRNKLNRFRTKITLHSEENYLILKYLHDEICKFEINKDDLTKFYFKDRILAKLTELNQNIESVNPVLFDKKIKITDFQNDLNILINKISYSTGAYHFMFINTKVSIPE